MSNSIYKFQKCSGICSKLQSAVLSPFPSALHPLTVNNEDEVAKLKKVFGSQTVPSQNTETELVLDGEDDGVSLLQEKELESLGGKSAH